jgi:phosphoglycerate kinase
MNIKKIQEADVLGKKVIVRVDFNVSVDNDGVAKSLYKIEAAKKTVDFLIENGAAHIALLTHFGRPGGEVKEEYSLEVLIEEAIEVFKRDVEFVSDCIGPEVQKALDGYAQGKIVLLENVRFYSEEKKDNAKFAAKLCAPFDLYINDAFAVCHREHASVHAITKCVPSFAGFWVQNELEHLSKVKNEPEQPAVAIIGGAKIDTKIPMIEEFQKKYSKVLVGGKTAVEAKDRGLKFDDSVVFPIDFAYKFYDIGPHTIKKYCDIISQAKTIVWNGPMGLIEKDEYKTGTIAFIEAIANNKDAFSLIGGGESVQMVEESGLINEISFISTGGGAMLAFLGGEEMPGIEVLKK